MPQSHASIKSLFIIFFLLGVGQISFFRVVYRDLKGFPLSPGLLVVLFSPLMVVHEVNLKLYQRVWATS